MELSTFRQAHRWLLWVVVVALWAATVSCRDRSVDRVIPNAGQDPVKIVIEADSQMFPKEWVGAPIHTSAKSLANKETARSLAAVRKAFAKYPPSLLRDNLDRVYIIRDLRFSGIAAAGTNSLNRVYVSVESKALGYSDAFIESTFHHEFSSILLRNYPRNFSKQQWKAVNPQGFQYQESGTDAIKAGKDSEDYDEELAKQGFFSQYAMWDFEDDFNTIATALFTGNTDLWHSAERFPPIETKVALMIGFYESLDPKFNREYFRELAKTEKRRTTNEHQ